MDPELRKAYELALNPPKNIIKPIKPIDNTPPHKYNSKFFPQWNREMMNNSNKSK